MNFHKPVMRVIGLSMIAALVACSNPKSTKITPTIIITANSGYTTAATIGGSFGTLAVTLMSNGSPVSGASVTFLAPQTGASGSFAPAPGSATDTETTNASGVATSQTFSANTTAGSYTVMATTSGATTPATFNLTNNAGAANAISVNAGSGQTATVSKKFPSPLAAKVVDSDGNGVAGVTVTFTVVPGATTGASAGFTTTGAIDTETTNASGVATTLQILTANATTGAFSVTADFTGDTGSAATFSLTNVAATLTGLIAGNYVFSVRGTDSGAAGKGASPYFAAGVFAVDSSGTITAGEMDFSDYSYFVAADPITGGSVAPSSIKGDSNLTITLNTGDANIGPGATKLGAGSGTLVFNVSMASSSRGLISEYDSWAASTGELNVQTSTSGLCQNAATTPCSYVFDIAGVDTNNAPISIGGIFAIDSAGGISGAGSIFDGNDGGTLHPGNAFNASKVGIADSMGLVTITLNSDAFSASPGIVLDGYIIDATHIRLIENWYEDVLNSTTGGIALGQTSTGAFTASSISGSSYVFATAGAVTAPAGPTQVAGVLTFQADGSMTGNLSWNDISGQSPQGGVTLAAGTTACSSGTAVTPCYTISSAGRVTITNVTDSTITPAFKYNLELYLTGDGNAVVISMDTSDVLAGLSWQQASGLGASSLKGSYALGVGQFVSGVEIDGDGVVTSDGMSTLTGFTDDNGSLAGEGLAPFSSLAATYDATSANGVLTVTGTGTLQRPYTVYLVDGTQGTILENDNSQLTLGYFANQ